MSRKSWPPVSAPRDREVKLRLAEDEMRAFKDRAALAKRSPAEFLRLIVLGEIDPSARQQEALRS